MTPNEFIKGIYPIVLNTYVSYSKAKKKVTLPSVCIAQAALESGWDLNNKSLFGIKGEGFDATTIEYIDGIEKEVQASFKEYESIAASVIGYYDLMQWSNYDDVTSKTTYEEQCYALCDDVNLKYATDPYYAEKIISIIEQYNLTTYDDRAKELLSGTPIKVTKEVVDVLAKETINGTFGNGEERRVKLGSLYDIVQSTVDELMKGVEK